MLTGTPEVNSLLTLRGLMVKIQIGDRCRLEGGHRQGYVSYVGEIPDLPEGIWVGVTLDRPVGKNSGCINGKEYFKCKENCGVFVREEKIVPFSTQLRKEEREARLKQQELDQDPSESVSGFWKDFNRSKAVIEELLAKETIDQTQLLDDIPHRIALLREEAARAAIFLANYDRRQALQSISTLEQTLETTKERVIPRKKFSFRSRTSAKSKPKVVEEQRPATTVEMTSSSSTLTFADRVNELILVQPADVKEIQCPDIVLTRLTNCTVCILTETYAIRGSKLEQCVVYSGPVAGSILLHDCSDCEFHVITRQLRVHDTLRTNFYLSIASNPIIEDCKDLGFAEYRITYEDLPQQKENAEMNFQTEMWKQVNDFKWHRTQPSPNWTCLDRPEIKIHDKASDFIGLDE